ncbi:hypothetical protein ACO0LL_21885 [Undibacterium sp. TC4M20W]|uniref:hypothetical protein n=1 Tax=Undibacterium sp. TC4M20W TaxID=3413052 RepID=UPI003BF0C6F0
MQRWRHAGDRKNFGDWLVLTIDIQMDEAGLQATCEQLIAATSDMEKFLDLGNGEQSSDYKIIFRHGEANVHERAFFHEAVKIAKLRPLVSQYVSNVNHESNTWQDEYHPRGSYAIAELVLADENYIPQFARLLFKWDMGHETYHYRLIDKLFEKYGYTEQTLFLLAARVCADGQNSGENVLRAIYRHDFKQQIVLEDFVSVALAIFPHPESAWQLREFARIYAGEDKAQYAQVTEIFLNALRKDKKFAAVMDEVQDSFAEEYDEHQLMEVAGFLAEETLGDWNEGLDEALVESTDLSKLMWLDA